MKWFRRIWRIVGFLAVAFTHTPYINLAARLRPVEERPAFRARCQQIGARALCRLLGVRVSLYGTLPDRAMLLVSNHLGVLDPLVVASQMPLAFAGMVELRTWPLIGWICRTVGLVFVERERPTRTSAFVRQVREKLRAGVPVLVFPEGTTSRGDEVRRFKTGAFEAVAESADMDVLPIYLNVVAVEGEPAEGERRYEVTWADGTQTFVEHGWHLLGLKSVHLQVRVGEPVTAAGRTRKDLARLTHQKVCALGNHRVDAPPA